MPATGPFSVVSVEESVSDGGTELWHVMCEHEGGHRRLHVFPKNTLIWRSIEYGIPMGDVDELLDLILHEPFIDEPADPRNFASDPAAKLGLVVTTEVASLYSVATREEPIWLYNAPSTEAAREAHRARLDHVKRTKASLTAPKAAKGARAADPLDKIRGSHAQVIELVQTDPTAQQIYGSMQQHIERTKRDTKRRRTGRQATDPAPWETRGRAVRKDF